MTDPVRLSCSLWFLLRSGCDVVSERAFTLNPLDDLRQVHGGMRPDEPDGSGGKRIRVADRGLGTKDGLVRMLHATLAVIAALFVALVIVANLECAPKYLERGDVRGLLGFGIAFSLLLAWASLGDTDRHRIVGALSCAGLTALFVSTASIPMLVAPVALVGAMRLPRLRSVRLGTAIAMPLVAVMTVAIPYLGQSGMSPDQFRCP